ncbi:SEC-C metal-binding domain-containing protein [Actinoplanes sp. L3-i22]|uniref:SEC-C metal-binding domain-containing protein n=1 Tax=Actinoplanes sp. L3-i22 TaxID=2836373 RepID=UPI001C77A082|nr:SEC-C metal-binding domain-containing protein [Actinoplanes sp. L3-i22]BCY05974.1 preprotein translocase SecA [Actinoplanes sp. L3-i22]
MPSENLLTIDDLDAIAFRSADETDPAPIVAELVAAVEQGRVADDEAAAHAYLLAAEITEQAGDLPAALGWAEKAATAPGEDGLSRACYAELLVKSGREGEGREVFDALRPELLQDPHAAAYVGEALESCGLATLADEWLSETARTLIEDGAFDEDAPGSDDADDFGPVDVLYAVLAERHRIREESLEVPHDELDGLFHEMDSAADAPDLDGQVLLFWPEAELAQVLARWPERADIYGKAWDEHRAGVERTLAGWSATGATHLGLLPASADALLAYASANDLNPSNPETHADYADDLADNVPATEWPPQRNAECWCASGAKYKKCCLPRSRG